MITLYMIIPSYNICHFTCLISTSLKLYVSSSIQSAIQLPICISQLYHKNTKRRRVVTVYTVVVCNPFIYYDLTIEMEVYHMSCPEKEVLLYRAYISSEPRFYKIKDIQQMTGWSENIVQKLFNGPNSPAANYGRTKVVEAHALIQFFSKRHEKERERYWW